MKTYELTDYIAQYFSHFALHQRGLSKNTLSSYSDAMILFLRFCQSQKGIRIEKIKFEHVSKSLVIEFCEWIEKEKHCSIATRNQRLTALHSVFRYILNETPMHLPLCRDILSIPMKKVPKKPPTYLSVGIIQQILSLPDPAKSSELRDLALMCLLYDAGLRVQELIELKLKDLILTQPPLVSVNGKGNKLRTIPLSKTTEKTLALYINRNHTSDLNSYLFLNRSGNPLTRAGVSYILNKYTKLLTDKGEDTPVAHISPHIFRHSKATHLLNEGINLIYIRDFLGHSSVTTTEIYASANPEYLANAIKGTNKMILTEKVPKEKKLELIEFLKELRS